jgi:hypothetical protein
MTGRLLGVRLGGLQDTRRARPDGDEDVREYEHAARSRRRSRLKPRSGPASGARGPTPNQHNDRSRSRSSRSPPCSPPSRSRSCALPSAGRSAWAETGLTAGQYTTTAAGAHGLATGFGDTASVGIGGITLGGGVGFLVRKHGLTIDDLLAAEVVTAAGQLLRTTRTRWLSRTKANGA